MKRIFCICWNELVESSLDFKLKGKVHHVERIMSSFPKFQIHYLDDGLQVLKIKEMPFAFTWTHGHESVRSLLLFMDSV